MYYIKVFFQNNNQLSYLYINELILYSYIEVNNDKTEVSCQPKKTIITKEQMHQYIAKFIKLWINNISINIICIEKEPSKDNNNDYNTIIDENKKLLIINNKKCDFNKKYKKIIEENNLWDGEDYRSDEIDYIPDYSLEELPKIKDCLDKLRNTSRLYIEDFRECIRILKNNYVRYFSFGSLKNFYGIIEKYNDYINYKIPKEEYLLEIDKLCETINKCVTKNRYKIKITKNFNENIIKKYGPKYNNDFTIKMLHDSYKNIKILKILIDNCNNKEKINYYNNKIYNQIFRAWRYDDENYKKIPYKIILISYKDGEYRINRNYSKQECFIQFGLYNKKYKFSIEASKTYVDDGHDYYMQNESRPKFKIDNDERYSCDINDNEIKKFAECMLERFF